MFYQLSHRMSKATKWRVRPTKAQISLDIRPIWSESSLSACRKLGFLAIHWAHSKDSGQTGRMPSLTWVFAGRTCYFVAFALARLCKLCRCQFCNLTSVQYDSPSSSNMIWVGAHHFLQDCMCAQRRLRSACASAQPDQHLQTSKASSSWQQRLWSACAEAQADLSLRGAHKQSFMKCCASARRQSSQHIIKAILIY